MQTGFKQYQAQYKHLTLQVDQVIEGWKVRIIDTKHGETINDSQLPGDLDEAKRIAVNVAQQWLALHGHEIDLEPEDLESKWSVSTQ